MAAHARTTIGAAPPSDLVIAAAPLSITALGLELMAVRERLRQIAETEESRPLRGERDDFYCTFRDREEALEAVIATMPAENLVEATIQIAVAGNIAAEVDRGVYEAPETHDARDELYRSLRRITLSVLPVLAAAAGLDENAMGWEDSARLRKHHFFGEECEA